MSQRRLLSWTGPIRRRVTKKKDVKKQVFNGRTEQDLDYDQTFAGLPDEVNHNIALKVSTEFHKLKIDLSNENIRGTAAEAVGTCLRTSPCRQLNLSHNYIRDVDIELVTKYLDLRSANLEVLDLSNNRIEDKGAKIIANLLEKNQSLKQLNLDTNGITSGIEEISSSLAKNNTLVHFSISWNDLSIYADEFYLAIMKNETLETVEMGYCRLNDVFADAIGTGLVSNTTLKELVLFGNQITDEGAASLSEAMEVNNDLIYLNLDNNLITDKGANLLLESIKEKEDQGMELTINLRQNQMSEQWNKKFKQIRQKQKRRKTEIIVDEDVEADTEDGSVSSDRHNTVTMFFNNKFVQISTNYDDEETDSEEEY